MVKKSIDQMGCTYEHRKNKLTICRAPDRGRKVEGGYNFMEQKSNNSINLSKSDYDFSLECPEFRERLLTEFISHAGVKETLPLMDKKSHFPL